MSFFVLLLKNTFHQSALLVITDQEFYSTNLCKYKKYDIRIVMRCFLSDLKALLSGILNTKKSPKKLFNTTKKNQYKRNLSPKNILWIFLIETVTDDKKTYIPVGLKQYFIV